MSDQGVRFLAEIRRAGMDILFPQTKHDKVRILKRKMINTVGITVDELNMQIYLFNYHTTTTANQKLQSYTLWFSCQVLCIIFVAFTLVRATAHKELIDLVMTVKESGMISNLENVSKTKVRGVIALLKLASIVETRGGINDKVPVTLTLSPTVDSIETLREQHDEFLSTFGGSQTSLWRDEVYVYT